MAVWIGTSGYNYPEWRGSFYPEKLSTTKMLAYYAERFPTVEINYTFYRTPSPKALEGWKSATPDPYKLTLKAPKRITHDRRLKDCTEALGWFLNAAKALEGKLGALLFQLPPTFKKDLDLLDAFLSELPPWARGAFEFRHPSWHDADVFARLRASNQALCIADSERLTTPEEITADYAYFRLRDEGYTPADIERWGTVVRDAGAACKDVFVYFKHEESGKGPEFARGLMDVLDL